LFGTYTILDYLHFFPKIDRYLGNILAVCIYQVPPEEEPEAPVVPAPEVPPPKVPSVPPTPPPPGGDQVPSLAEVLDTEVELIMKTSAVRHRRNMRRVGFLGLR
jgi:hypothetical protein